MKIKTKLYIGIGVLFALILLLALTSAKYLYVLSNNTESILKANYNSLEYSRSMLVAMDEGITDTANIAIFERNLKKQQNNITEIGEQEATDKLARDFTKVKHNLTDKTLMEEARKDIYEIISLNMRPIERKSDAAIEAAKSATLWVTITGTLCLLIAFTLLINLPGYIANPIRELTESIKQIASRNYSQRVNFENHDEFGELAIAFNTMAGKLEEYENSNLSKILFEKKRIETLINNMPDPVIGLDEHKKILFVNNRAQAIIGINEQQLVGRYAQDIAVTNDLIRSLIVEIMQPNVVYKDAKQVSMKIFADNKESYFEKETMNIFITPTGEKEKKLIGHVIFLNNVTPFKELDFAKTNFIATLSHEFKTPISSIKMSLQLLEKTETGFVNGDQKQLISSIKEDCDRLLKITGELLNLAQVETGNIQLNIHPTDPTEILHYAIETVKTQAENKQIKLNIKVDTNLGQIKADTEKTAWVLINLLTNAIRYSPEKSDILVEIKRVDERVLFSVTDYGPGIDRRYLQRIFDRYFQIPGSNKSGAGLGLAISKEFIEAQGGHIGVESEVGMGSRFFFEFA